MLLRPDETFYSEVTKRAERVFPVGTAWQIFESKMPAADVFKSSVLDPAVGVLGDIGMRAFANSEWQNWVSSIQIGIYDIATRIGLPSLGNAQLQSTVSDIYTSITASLDAFKDVDRAAEMLPDLLVNAGLQALQKIAASTGIIGQVIAQVITTAVWAVDVYATHKNAELAKDVALPPLQTEDPATDSWQVNRVFELFRKNGSGGVVYPDGEIEGAANADYTKLFLPAYAFRKPWMFQHREGGIAAQQGAGQEARGPLGETQYLFDPGDVSTFGFMPGTAVSLRVLQASYRYYHSVRGTPVDRYTLRCKGIDKPCYKKVKAFDGSRDCRQCVDAESVWPVKGVGWGYGGVPLNVTTPGENVGAFYPSTNKLLLNILEMATRPGPMLYTLNVEDMDLQWKTSFELFWEFVSAEWRRYRGAGWRGLISRLATLMTALDRDGMTIPGGRDPRMPAKLIGSPRESTFDVPFSASVYSRIIAPFCSDLLALQRHYLETLEVAYIPPGAGALYVGKKVRRNELGDRFVAARQALLASHKRVLVDLRQVSDPEYRRALEDSGVKLSPVNPYIKGPGVSGHELLAPDIKPPRVPTRPRTVAESPLAGLVEFGKEARGEAQSKQAVSGTRKSMLALGVAAGGGAMLSAVAWALAREERDKGT
ncbi:hypothetical protein G6O69_37225 [Pseudenhygromyxa sp. WMMC2535]|nr:hypothetical protein [Pseudenhygromyxa sp. WMMC2535]NVB40342.1 hypothetical protein [Pseudenhygromyxa sp. WMMC2535]NVB43520.1 hypothetical protein [Pseudenhygromyxa sp. WMMC2535]